MSRPAHQLGSPATGYKTSTRQMAKGSAAGAIILAGCIASAASADTVGRFCDGLGSASIERDGSEYVVTVVNPFCPNNGWSDDLTVITLEIDGLHIAVQLWSQPGRTPDAFVVIAPPGWLADPASLTVEEQDSGVIRLRMMGLS